MTDDEREKLLAQGHTKGRAEANIENRLFDAEAALVAQSKRIDAIEGKLDKWFRNAVLALLAGCAWLFQDSLDKIKEFLRS
jgi:hypothetical protein